MIATILFSLVASIVLIVHGLFFDLDPTQVSRLTFKGFIVTFILTFLGLLLMEKIFTLDEDEEIVRLKRRVRRLEKTKR